jgi:3-oxoacyl-[acyl-carrier protein] reductase
VNPRPTGRRVLVTGGTRGIGRVTTLAFARAGAHVLTCHRSASEAANSLVGALKEFGEQHRVVRADVTRPEHAAQLADACLDVLGGLDVVVNNVGVDGQGPIEELSRDEWCRVLDGNLTGCYLVTQATLPLLSDGASIVNVGASVALRGRVNGAHYCASKAAIIGFTRSLAKELGSRGIRVNTVAPGLVETEPDAGLLPPVVERIKGMTALGRLGTPEDVAGAVLFLASDASRYITGVTLNVDGGM